MTDDRPIDLENVTFGYTSQPVLRDVSLSIAAGEYVGVVGPNGSGKSTLLRIALGLHDPDEGVARLFGRPSSVLADRERVGYVAQEATANAGSMPITVREFVRLGRYPLVGFGRLRREDREKTREALRTVAIDDLADRRVGRLSGGQRQRAAIARALAADADLLVLDEPTVGVDAESVGVFYDLLDRLHADGMTILLVEHDLGAVLDRASRVVCLDREVFYDGPPEGLAESGALAEAYGTAGFFEEVTTA